MYIYNCILQFNHHYTKMLLTVNHKGSPPSEMILKSNSESFEIKNENYSFIIPSTEYPVLIRAFGMLSKVTSYSFSLNNHLCNVQVIGGSLHTIMLTVCNQNKVTTDEIHYFELNYFVLVGNTELSNDVVGYLQSQENTELEKITVVLERITKNGAFPSLHFNLEQ